VFDAELSDVMAQAITQPGFAFVEVWELCSAYYQPRNGLKKKDQLLGLIDGLGFARGLLVDRPRPEYSERYRQAYEAGKSVLEKKAPIVPRFAHGLTRQTGIIVAGSAGQKIKSTATLFAEAAIFSGLMATQKDDYPITVQTGHSVAEIILSPNSIEYTGIDAPDYVLVVSEEGERWLRSRMSSLPAHCLVLADEGLALGSTPASVLRLPFARIAKEQSPQSVVTAALTALLQRSELFSKAAFEHAIRSFQKPKIADINCVAMAAGAAMMTNKSDQTSR
jgi:Pyruvate/2-oxoacid:ferredoxin oxidoreductase gamma subunit